MDNQSILEVKGLTKIYGTAKAVDAISFSVRAGEIVGLLGPNGAGKTTTINMILGVLEPSGGSVEIFRNELKRNRGNIMERVNFAAIYAHVPGNQSVWENLYIFGLLYGVDNLKEKISMLLKEFSLEEFADTKAGILASGEQTRVALAKAMINTPKLLLLDEPTASLDPSTALLTRDKIRKYAAHEQAAILWTSHNMHEVEVVCDRVLFLSHGRILLEGNPKTLTREYKKKNLEELFITIAREPLSLEITS